MRTSALLAILVFTAGCWSGHTEPPAPSGGSSSTKELIGGFAAYDSALDAIGSMSLKFVDEFTGEAVIDLVCSGSLLDSDTVVTAKHCLDAIAYYSDYAYQLGFGVGSTTSSPSRWVEVIASEGAPQDNGGFNGYGRDVGVLHLAAPLDGIPTVKIAALTDADVGSELAAIGFGDQSNGGGYGSRRVGAVELRARSGRTFELLLGSFPAFYEWYIGEPLPAECADVEADSGGGGGIIIFEPAIAIPGVPRSPRAGTVWGAPHRGQGGQSGGPGKASGAAGGGEAGSGGAQPEADGGVSEPVDCSFAAYVRSIYESVLLEQDGEVVVGGTEGDAQPCYGDSGSPLVRSTAAGLVAYGVVSGGLSSRQLICDYGAVYAAFDADVLAFLERAKDWVDPCEGLTTVGVCDASVATRCSTFSEGPRRKLRFDCATVGLGCESQHDGSIGCGQDDSSLAPPTVRVSPDQVITVPRVLLSPVFKHPPR
jgi:hypothetical protein